MTSACANLGGRAAALANIDYARFQANDTRQCRRDVSAVLAALEEAARKLPAANGTGAR